MADQALLLGINDYQKVNPLRGCVNDVRNMQKLLTETFRFDPRNIRVLLNEQVVKKSVNQEMDRLFKDARSGDRVVLHFSGHGSYTEDLDGDEPDGKDELLCLYDMDFADPETYLLDDELRHWTEKLPRGVQLTIVFDSCHSGTATRLVMAPAPDNPHRQIPMRVDDRATLARAPQTARGLASPAALAAAVDPATNPDVVRVRFVDPPPTIKAAVAKRARQANRGLVVVKRLNHVLLAACRDDQTAADATIEATPNGAFTYHLCRTIRDGGARLDRKQLIDRVARALSDGHFEQVPQLETALPSGPLFGTGRDTDDGSGGGGPDGGTPPPEPGGGGVTIEELKAVLPDIVRRVPAAQVEALRLRRGAPGRAPAAGRRAPRAVGERFLVYVHGICRHDAGYSDAWWDALHPFTSTFGEGKRDRSRLEVLWSDLVNERAVRMDAARAVDPRAAREADERRQAADEIREALRDRVDRHVVDAGPAPIPGAAPRGLADARGLVSIPGLNCLDDFTVYLVNDNTRAEVIARFTGVVKPLLAQGGVIDIVAHSWGTVVAYEGLRELEDAGLTEPQVHTFFTAGAALSLAPVKRRLRRQNRDGRRPAPVHRWVNLNARGDMVGGPLQDRPYRVDDDFPNLDPFGCGSLFGIVSPICAHESYFVAGNEPVNRDIFARFIDEA
jgi:hypothetical protein